MPSRWQNKFLHLNGHLSRTKLFQDHFSEVNGQGFDEFPVAAIAEAQQALAQREIVESGIQVIGGGRLPEIETQLEREVEALRLGTFLVGDADVIPNFKVRDGNRVHA